MSRLLFIAERLRKLNYRALRDTLRLLKRRSGRGAVRLLGDMARCAVRYGAGYMDYKIAEMYTLDKQQRRTVITRGISNRIVKRMNPKAHWHYFDLKTEFNTLFSTYVRRGWMPLDAQTDTAQISAFLEGKSRIIAKPADGSSGQGIACYESREWENSLPAFLSRLRADGAGLLEEVVIQHEILQALCPTSVNTIRIATLLGDKRQGVVYAFLRIGNGRVMDNVDCGGMAARVDPATGTVLTVAADKQGNTYKRHPMTDMPIVGITIPFWEDCMRICLEASQVVPSMRFIAWDVAVTPDGPVFIEGNSFPSHAIPQFAAHYPDGQGILTEFERFIDVRG